jgi:hypothetical protein
MLTKQRVVQVGLMRNIFEEADRVLGWLGDDPIAKKAFALARRINEVTTAAAYLSLRLELDAGWRELEKIMSHEWFERAW